MKATRNGKLEAVKRLLAAGCSVSVRDRNSDTALHFAARHGNARLLSALIAASSADINMQVVAAGAVFAGRVGASRPPRLKCLTPVLIFIYMFGRWVDFNPLSTLPDANSSTASNLAPTGVVKTQNSDPLRKFDNYSPGSCLSFCGTPPFLVFHIFNFISELEQHN